MAKKKKEKHKREQIKPIFGLGGAPKYSQTLSDGVGKGRDDPVVEPLE